MSVHGTIALLDRLEGNSPRYKQDVCSSFAVELIIVGAKKTPCFVKEVFSRQCFDNRALASFVVPMCRPPAIAWRVLLQQLLDSRFHRVANS